MTGVRIGLAGYGFGGRYFHAPFLAAAPECDFMGVVTTSTERQRQFAEAFPGRRTFDSLDALAAAGEETVRLAEGCGLALSAYRNRRWESDFRTVRKALADGVLGSPVRFESRFERFAPEPGPSAAGGGTLLDFGSHLVDQALVLFGPARSVYAEMHVRDDAASLDDDVFVAITHSSGVHSHLWGSWRQSASGPRFRV